MENLAFKVMEKLDMARPETGELDTTHANYVAFVSEIDYHCLAHCWATVHAGPVAVCTQDTGSFFFFLAFKFAR